MAAMPWIEHLTARHWLTLHGIVVVLGLVFYVTASHARRQRRHPSAAIAWVMSLALVPYVALPLYLLFGNRKVLRGQAPRVILPTLAGTAPTLAPAARFQQLAGAMGLAPAARYEQLAIHEDGRQALAALTALMNGAQWTLDLCTFLIGRDAIGDEVLATLMRRAREGVRVRLLIDGIGVYLGRRAPFQATGGGRRPGDAVRVALALAAAGPHQPAQPPQDGDRRWRAPVVRRAQPGRRILHRRPGPDAGRAGLDRPELRPARRPRAPGAGPVRAGLGLRDRSTAARRAGAARPRRPLPAASRN